MLVLRVRCVDDGRELLLERHGADAYSIQVAELKALVLQERGQNAGLGDCFLLLKGQILADPDVVDLNALGAADFFVFAIDSPSPGGGGGLVVADGGEDAQVHEVLTRHLQDMGFPVEVARRALQQTRNNLAGAVALLADGNVASGDEEKAESNEVKSKHPTRNALSGLVDDSKMKRLQELAATDSFQAMLLLRDQFESQELTQLNENPVATLNWLSLPVSRAEFSLPAAEQDEIIDAETGSWPAVENGGAIDRLVAMGFERGLVQAVYESCGNDEQLAANALLQTLES